MDLSVVIANKMQIDDYVFRKPSKDKFELFTPDLINSRINRIKNWVGNKYLTIGALYTSGMITVAEYNFPLCYKNII